MNKRKRPTHAVKAPEKPKAVKLWPMGSAVMRPPTHKKYRPHPHVYGEKDEKNPNLLGRVCKDRDGGGYDVWKWGGSRKGYSELGHAPTFPAAMVMLRTAHGE
jgi:hypothetical protein